jgi:hypothetical protein
LEKALKQGEGKIWLIDGHQFIGNFNRDKMSEGRLYELKEDNTFSIYQVKYDA